MPEVFNDKATARSRFVNDRSTDGDGERRRAGEDFASTLVNAPELRAARMVCAYRSFGMEPDTGPLIAALHARGVRVLLPVLLADRDLDWAEFDGRFAAGRMGLSEPVGDRLGPDAIAEADVVITPALAISSTGDRLGRGGGSYDRALARVAKARSLSDTARPWTCALVYARELGAAFPVDEHDRPVDAVCVPGRIVRFSGA